MLNFILGKKITKSCVFELHCSSLIELKKKKSNYIGIMPLVCNGDVIEDTCIIKYPYQCVTEFLEETLFLKY